MTVYAADWVLPVDTPSIERGAVAVEDGRIAAVGTTDELGPADRTFDAAAIVPGFVNAHSHLEYAVYAGFGDGRDFGPWLMVHVARKRLLELLAARGVGVAHCPRSNALLGCGIAPVRALLDAGAKVGLGTDSPASTPSFDLFDELRAAVAAARARERRSDALSAADALELATLGSARALGLEAEVGSLTSGKSADLAVVSLAGSPYWPVEDPAAAVVFGGWPDRVLCTLVQGDVRYEKGVTDWHGLTVAAASARARMLGRAAAPVRALM